MRKILRVLVLGWLGWQTMGLGQPFPDPYRYPEQNEFVGGVGVTWIDGESFTTLTLAPDLAFGKWGVGIYLQLLFDNNNGFKLREDEYKEGAGILRAIRYLRYGQKYDPYFFRIGAIDRAMLGSGFLMWNYNNGSNYDKRKIGLIADVDLDRVGFESMMSSVGTSNLQGYNVYVRPLRFMADPPPIINKLRIYTTFIRDNEVADTRQTDSTFSRESVTAFSIGADFPWLDLRFVRSAIYADYSKFKDFGDGKAVGVQVVFPEFIGLFGLAARLEKRFMNDHFVPNLFGPLYELERKLPRPQGVFGRLDAAKKTEGIFGELSGHVIHKVQLIGSFQKLNGISHSGILHLEANAPTLVPKFDLRGYYDKTNIETFRDARTLDINSVLTAEVGYELNRFMLAGVVYRWYWVEDPNNPGTFKPIERVEPRISFRYNF